MVPRHTLISACRLDVNDSSVDESKCTRGQFAINGFRNRNLHGHLYRPQPVSGKPRRADAQRLFARPAGMI